MRQTGMLRPGSGRPEGAGLSASPCLSLRRPRRAYSRSAEAGVAIDMSESKSPHKSLSGSLSSSARTSSVAGFQGRVDRRGCVVRSEAAGRVQRRSLGDGFACSKASVARGPVAFDPWFAKKVVQSSSFLGVGEPSLHVVESNSPCSFPESWQSMLGRPGWHRGSAWCGVPEPVGDSEHLRRAGVELLGVVIGAAAGGLVSSPAPWARDTRKPLFTARRSAKAEEQEWQEWQDWHAATATPTWRPPRKT